MKSMIRNSLFSAILFVATQVKGYEIVKVVDLESGDALLERGDTSKPFSPCSTFKIPLALIGFESGILQTAGLPQWMPTREDKEASDFWLVSWDEPQTPESWLRNSAVWYSQHLTHRLGMDQFQAYIDKLKYGNQDLSGNPGKHDGLTHAWLSSSLKISPREQIIFLGHLLNKQLPLTDHAMDETIKLLHLEELDDGWVLYGKTGSGAQGPKNLGLGWLVGWITNGKRTYVFSYTLIDEEPQTSSAGRRAKNNARSILNQLIARDQRRDPLRI